MVDLPTPARGGRRLQIDIRRQHQHGAAGTTRSGAGCRDGTGHRDGTDAETRRDGTPRRDERTSETGRDKDDETRRTDRQDGASYRKRTKWDGTGTGRQRTARDMMIRNGITRYSVRTRRDDTGQYGTRRDETVGDDTTRRDRAKRHGTTWDATVRPGTTLTGQQHPNRDVDTAQQVYLKLVQAVAQSDLEEAGAAVTGEDTVVFAGGMVLAHLTWYVVQDAA